jgi:hypothetical protein
MPPFVQDGSLLVRYYNTFLKPMPHPQGPPKGKGTVPGADNAPKAALRFKSCLPCQGNDSAETIKYKMIY